MNLYDEFKAAFADIIVPELHAIRDSLRAIREDVACLRADLRPWRRDILAEIQRLEERIAGLQGALERPLSCSRVRRRRRAG